MKTSLFLAPLAAGAVLSLSAVQAQNAAPASAASGTSKTTTSSTTVTGTSGTTGASTTTVTGTGAVNTKTGDTKTKTGDRASTDVGLSANDGITVSGADAFITRNGVTEKIAKDVTLQSGVTVRPDGTFLMADGTKITIRPNQLLTLDGKLIEAPVRRTSTPVAPGSSTTNAGAPGTPATSK